MCLGLVPAEGVVMRLVPHPDPLIFNGVIDRKLCKGLHVYLRLSLMKHWNSYTEVWIWRLECRLSTVQRGVRGVGGLWKSPEMLRKNPTCDNQVQQDATAFCRLQMESNVIRRVICGFSRKYLSWYWFDTLHGTLERHETYFMFASQ